MLNSLLFAMLLASDSLSITFTGDVLLDRGVRQFVEHRSVDKLFSPFVDSVFQSSDLVVANLECPATKIRQPAFKQYIFRAEPEWLQTLKAHGITHLNLANNHSVDQGRIGLADTKKNIQETGMIPVGAGDNMQEAAQPVLLASTPRNVYLLTSLQMPLENFSYLPDKTSVSHEDLDSLKTRVRQLKETDPCCYIIVSLHWGGEHTLRPVPLQRQQAHQLIDAGVDALICHHTHTLQTIEQYQGKPIYYSIGNFIFDQKKPINSKACMVKVTIKKESSHIETIPIVIRNCVPEKP
ncbi:CapA family protein [Prevotella sp. tf2-5]|jgi:poly-gamma-glutamate synthesis protein (capsule biosynthesis protein)|uniref:CapA family protein n=1 Tax=Prevotella sp. tf2-5 TaxID=1761889 RepID=UPI0008DFFF7A|nr:CapA family protein [Prevotella sp. tf2-5]MCR5712206.1 CapA family protein [Prevotella sp.]SFO69920.1 poly-gamma-glutamate synthesis protein (capsule biosynthesis protein) [Prevotella sp. tf2-5]